MENTLENKAKFFGNYLGQEIAFDKAGFKALVYDAIKPSWIESFYLELKPLSHITDEDAINLGYGYVSHLKSNLDRNIDQLRNLGYALPWMDLSVEDLIEYGWIKLKEN